MLQLAYRPARMGCPGGYAIDALSGFGGFCHVELLFSNGECFSSTLEEGVRFTRRDLTGWTLEPIPDVTGLDEETARVWAQREVGSPYDEWGVCRFVLPFVRQSPSRWFCSEICAAALQRINRLPGVDAWRVSPNALRKLDKAPQYVPHRPAA